MMDTVRTLLYTVSLRDIIDIAIISYLLYRVLILLQGTRAFNMLFSVLLLLLMLSFSEFLGLTITSWVLNNVSGYLFLALIIIFQPELRRALAFLGESKWFESSTSMDIKLTDELVRSVTSLANKQLGAIIVIQRSTNLHHYVELGTKIDSVVSKDLLLSIFIPYSPLHDGAVLLEGNKLTYAGCILPLTKRIDLAQDYGTRHRAAIGITEETDAVVIVVSEERGTVAVAVNGNISSELDASSLKEVLESIFKLRKMD